MGSWVFQLSTESLGVIANRLTLVQEHEYLTGRVPGRDGVIPLISSLNERRISWSGIISATSAGALQTKIDSLQSLLWGAGACELQLKLHDDRHLNCQVVGFDIEPVEGTAASVARLKCTLVAPDPYFINNTSFSAVNCVASGSSVLSFSLVNTGTALTPFLLRFTPRSGTHIGAARLDNLTTGRRLEITTAVSFNNEIIVRITSFTATNSAGGSLLSNFTGEFWRLNPGSNSLVFQGSACNVTIEFNPRHTL